MTESLRTHVISGLALALSTVIPTIFYIATVGLGPIILTDELTFSRDILYASPWEATLGNPLQIVILGFAKLLPNWYETIRLSQMIIFAAGIFFTYLLMKNFMKQSLAIVSAVFFSAFPTWIFLSTTMAEGLLVGFLPIFLYFLYRTLSSTKKIHLFLFLLLASTLTLIKPHSILVVGLSLLLVGRRTPLLSKKHALVRFSTVVASFALLRAAMGLVIGGPATLAPFGRYFNLGILDEPLQLNVNQYQSTYFDLLPEAKELFEQLDPLQAALASFPLYAGFWLIALAPLTILCFWRIDSTTFNNDSISWILGSLTAALNLYLLFSWIFGGYITAQGDNHADRLLLRYLEYILPFAYLFFALQMKRLDTKEIKLRLVVSATAAISFVLYSTGIFRGINLSLADSTFFAGIAANELSLALFLVGILILTYCRYLTSQRSLLSSFTAGLFLIVSSSQLTTIKVITAPDRHAADSLISILDENKIESQVLFLGESRLSSSKLLFQFNDLSSRYGISSPNVSVKAQAIPSDFQTVVFLDNTIVGEGFTIIERTRDFVIAEPNRRNLSNLTFVSLGDEHSLEGSFSLAPSTIWATADSTDIILSETAPSGATIELEIQVYEFFKGGELVLTSGSQVERFQIPPGGRSGVVSFTLKEPTSNISVNLPVTRLDLPEFSDRFGQDFGVGIKSLRIKP